MVNGRPLHYKIAPFPERFNPIQKKAGELTKKL